ncbi:MAG TPA: rhamnan synthesis F family protein, partial [Rubrivivax sp.]|nr:rhamnan synthesis F family protein [Rubrivivax sp.]
MSRRLIAAWQQLARRHPRSAPRRWLKRPRGLAGKEVCLFVSYARNGILSEHALFHARAWSRQGFAVVMIVVLDDMASFGPASDLDFCSGVLVRANVGYDFGAWATAVAVLPELRDAALLAMVNDSVFGPLSSFPRMLAQTRACDGDVVGLIESFEIRHHLQSFVVFYKPKALKSAAFRKFWRSVRVGDRAVVIEECELQLWNRFEQAGLTVKALFPADVREEPCNP